MQQLLNKSDILKAADWFNKKKQLNENIEDHMKLCRHWSVKEVRNLDNLYIQNIYECEFCGKEIDKSQINSYTKYYKLKPDDL